jgi:hypothetical protein
MATPIYSGCGQPRVGGGFLSGLGLGSWFGGQTPAYAGEDQPIPGASGYFGSSTPAYRNPSVLPQYADGPEITVVIPRDLITHQ